MTDAEWDALDEDWLEQALAYAAVPCKGARGPLTRIRPRPGPFRDPTGRPGSLAGAADGPEYRLADLAADCGYFDQAHLAREFRALAGCPPSQWLAEEFRNVQAGNWVTEEGWQ